MSGAKRGDLRRRQTGEGKEKLFDNILNFRDVGKTINDFLGEKYVAEGKIFRSARPGMHILYGLEDGGTNDIKMMQPWTIGSGCESNTASRRSWT